MRGINSVTIFGNAGRQPEGRQTASGKLVCDLSIATSHPRRQGDSWVEETTWHRVTLWEEQADRAIRLVRKGTPVAVHGELRTESWTDADGRPRSRSYVLARTFDVGRWPDDYTPGRRKGEAGSGDEGALVPRENGERRLDDTAGRPLIPEASTPRTSGQAEMDDIPF